MIDFEDEVIEKPDYDKMYAPDLSELIEKMLTEKVDGRKKKLYQEHQEELEKAKKAYNRKCGINAY